MHSSTDRSDPASIPCDRAQEAYVRAFESSPAALAFAPGRANLIGDHTDYCEGFVFPVALGIGCAAAIGEGNKSQGTGHEFVAVDLRERCEIGVSGRPGQRDLDGVPGWARYLIGVIDCWHELHPGIERRALRVGVSSTVPPGSGLSSSAALEVSLATALDEMLGVETPVVEKALLCQRAEHLYAGVPCGIMDQYISAGGREGYGLLIDCRDLSANAVPIDIGSAAFALFSSEVSHQNSDGAYERRRSACERAAAKLGVKALRDVSESDVREHQGRLEQDEFDAALHVTTENARVTELANAMQRGELGRAGALMRESHRSLSETYKVSCPELDRVAHVLEETEGVYGARMTGAGFGGWVLALIQEESLSEAQRRVHETTKAWSETPTNAMRIVPADGAHARGIG